MKKIVIQAEKAKRAGYKNIASIVRRHYNTSYYHVVSIDLILSRNKWIPAPKILYNGITEKSIDWTKTIKKTELGGLI
jgi:hypothetical protein